MRDRTFGPAVLGGLATAALTAVAAAQDWGVATGDNAGVTATGRAGGATTPPRAHPPAHLARPAGGLAADIRSDFGAAGPGGAGRGRHRCRGRMGEPPA